jgi:phosphoribosylformylglycinamidine synthase
VTGGNVSFYNQTGDTPIFPTPVVGVLGVIDDVARRTRQAFRTDRAGVYLLGDTRDEFGGSEWMHAVHGFLGGHPPAVDLGRERLLAGVLIDAARAGLLDGAHDLSEGGLAQALAESCLRADAGAVIELPPEPDPFVALFAESTGRALVSVTRHHEQRFTARCAARGLPCTRIGVVDLLVGALAIGSAAGRFEVTLRELRAAWSAPFPARFE